MPFGIHALDIRVIVLPLGPPAGLLGCTGACHAADNQSRPGTNACTLLATDGGTGDSADDRSDRSTRDRRLLRTLLRSCPAILLERIATTAALIHPEIIKRPAAARQYHDARSGWRANAPRQYRTGEDGQPDF